MTYFRLTFCLFLFTHSLYAQCPCPIKQFLLYPSSKSISLKWACTTKPNNGQFILYRTCLSPIKEGEKQLVTYNYSEHYDHADGHLKYGYRYEYRLKFISSDCSCDMKAAATIEARANEDTILTSTIEHLKDYKQYDLCTLVPQKMTIQANHYVETQITFKNPKALKQTDFKYYIIFGDTMVETTAEFNNAMNFQLASIFIHDNPKGINECKIAITSGKDIIGMSNIITIEK